VSFDDEQVLDAGDVADLLRVHRYTVTAMFRTGVLPGRKAGREWRTTRRAILAWLEQDPRPAAHDTPTGT